MTKEEREALINAHMSNYNMSREEAEATVATMTDTELDVTRRHGIGRGKKEESISERIARIRQEVQGKEIPAADVVESGNLFYKIAQQLCSARRRTFVDTAEFHAGCAGILDWLQNYDNSPRRWLLIAGGVGTGKTTAAKAALAVLRQRCINCVEKEAYEVALLYQNINKQRAADEYEFLKRVEFLFLDDIGIERNPAALDEILYTRYNNMRCTIFTTNLDYHALREVYGARIFDRMQELVQLVEFSGESFRHA